MCGIKRHAVTLCGLVVLTYDLHSLLRGACRCVSNGHVYVYITALNPVLMPFLKNIFIYCCYSATALYLCVRVVRLA